MFNIDLPTFDFEWTERKRIAVAIVCALAALGAAGGGVYYAWLTSTPPMPQTVEDAAKLMKDPRFARLPESRKAEYMQVARTVMAATPRDDRREAFRTLASDPAARKNMREMMQAQMEQRIVAFAQASPKERDKMLDTMIDQMEMMRKLMPARASAGNASGGSGGGDRPSPRGPRDPRERMKGFLEHGNPQMGALAMQFMQALDNRRKERGLPPMQRFGPGARNG